MVFIWQAPMMLMAYAACFFLIGLTIYVCTPLLNGEVSSPGGKTGVFYLAVLALSGAIFIYCSFWAYRFIDLDKMVGIDMPATEFLPVDLERMVQE